MKTALPLEPMCAVKDILVQNLPLSWPAFSPLLPASVSAQVMQNGPYSSVCTEESEDHQPEVQAAGADIIFNSLTVY